MAGKATFDDQVKAGKVKLEGKAEVLAQLKSVMVHFDPKFELLPGTREGPAQAPEMNPFEQEPIGKTEGG